MGGLGGSISEPKLLRFSGQFIERLPALRVDLLFVSGKVLHRDAALRTHKVGWKSPGLEQIDVIRPAIVTP